MIEPFEGARSFHRQNISGLFNNAEFVNITAIIIADRTTFGGGKKSTDVT